MIEPIQPISFRTVVSDSFEFTPILEELETLLLRAWKDKPSTCLQLELSILPVEPVDIEKSHGSATLSSL